MLANSRRDQTAATLCTLTVWQPWMDVKSCIFHLTLKVCIGWFLFSLSLLMLSENVQIAPIKSCNTVAGYYQRLPVCLSVLLSTVCMSLCLLPSCTRACLAAVRSGATSMIQALNKSRKVTENEKTSLCHSSAHTYNYILLIPLCKAGLNPCVNVLSKHYIHILWLWRLLLSI